MRVLARRMRVLARWVKTKTKTFNQKTPGPLTARDVLSSYAQVGQESRRIATDTGNTTIPADTKYMGDGLDDNPITFHGCPARSSGVLGMARANQIYTHICI